MKISKYKSFEELPLFLNAAMIAEVLGIAPSSAYELMHEAGFPMLKIGNRMVVPKDKFIEWVLQALLPTDFLSKNDLKDIPDSGKLWEIQQLIKKKTQ